MPYLRATSSAEMPWGTMSYCSSSSGGKGTPGPWRTVEPIGTRVIDSTPPAIVMSAMPLWIRLAAKWIACWLEPHWRSTVVAGVSTGKPAVSQALRPMFTDCSPVCMTVPQTTSSTSAGSIPARLISSWRTIDPSSTGWKSLSFPFRLPSGVRTASTITASRISPLLLPALNRSPEDRQAPKSSLAANLFLPVDLPL